MDVSYQISIYLAKRFQRRRFFLEIGHSETRIAYGGHVCLLTDRDKMRKFYRGSFIDASFQVSLHLAKRLQMRRFLEIEQSGTRTACGGHVC